MKSSMIQTLYLIRCMWLVGWMGEWMDGRMDGGRKEGEREAWMDEGMNR